MATQQKILIVDDYEPNLVALESILGTERPAIRATSGAQALRLLLREEVALVLLDVQMPEMDGFETAALIHKNPKLVGLPIIFLTAMSKEERFINQGYRAGAIDYLCKPLKPALVRAKVDFFLKLGQQKRELEEKIAQAHAHLDAFRSGRVAPAVGAAPVAIPTTLLHKPASRPLPGASLTRH